jgi:uncharacterized lipoprotein
MTRAAALLAVLALALLSACSPPRTHAKVRLTPDGAKVSPGVSTSILGIGLTVTE